MESQTPGAIVKPQMTARTGHRGKFDNRIMGRVIVHCPINGSPKLSIHIQFFRNWIWCRIKWGSRNRQEVCFTKQSKIGH